VLSLFCTLFSLHFAFFALFFLCDFDHNGISLGINRKTATPCCDDVSSIYTRPSAAKKYFLQGPCFYGQRRLCVALCILSSLYEHPSSPWSTPLHMVPSWRPLEEYCRLNVEGKKLGQHCRNLKICT
jgi:hypothetical protein